MDIKSKTGFCLFVVTCLLIAGALGVLFADVISHDDTPSTETYNFELGNTTMMRDHREFKIQIRDGGEYAVQLVSEIGNRSSENYYYIGEGPINYNLYAFEMGVYIKLIRTSDWKSEYRKIGSPEEKFDQPKWVQPSWIYVSVDCKAVAIREDGSGYYSLGSFDENGRPREVTGYIGVGNYKLDVGTEYGSYSGGMNISADYFNIYITPTMQK